MFSVIVTEKGGPQATQNFDKSEVTIGRVKGNDIVLPKGNVSKRHSRIVVKDGKFIIVDLKSTNGTYVNGRKISAPQVIKESDKIYIGDFILTVKEDESAQAAPDAGKSQLPGLGGPGGAPPGPPGPPGLGGPGPMPSGPPGLGGPGGPGPVPSGPPGGLSGPPGLGGPGGPGMGRSPTGMPAGPSPSYPPPGGPSGPGGPGLPGGPAGPGRTMPPPGTGPGPMGPRGPSSVGPGVGGPPGVMSGRPASGPAGLGGPGGPGASSLPGGPGGSPLPGGPGASGLPGGPSGFGAQAPTGRPAALPPLGGPGRGPAGPGGPPGLGSPHNTPMPSGNGSSPGMPSPSRAMGPAVDSLEPEDISGPKAAFAPEPTGVSHDAPPSSGNSPTAAPAPEAAPPSVDSAPVVSYVAARPRRAERPLGRATMPPRPQLRDANTEALQSYAEAARMVMDALLGRISPQELPQTYPASNEVKDRIYDELSQALDSLDSQLPASVDRAHLIESLFNEAVALGPLEYYLDDPEVTDIYVNGAARILLQRRGELTVADRVFSGEDFLYLTALRLLSVQGYTEAPPAVSEVRFGDGTLLHVTMPPVAVGGPFITVRKPRRQFASLSEMVEQGGLSNSMAEFLHQCIEARRTILVVGPQGAGRTTLVNALVGLIPDGSRLVSVENTSMLELHQRSALRLEPQSASAYSEAVGMPALVEHALRIRPERLIVDELRGAEAMGFLNAIAAGAAGSIGVLSGLSSYDGVQRLSQLAALAGRGLGQAAIDAYVARSVDVVFVVNRFADGVRRVVEVAEVVDRGEGPGELETIFTFEHDGMGSRGGATGRFVATGYVPRFYRELERGGVKLDTAIFRG